MTDFDNPKGKALAAAKAIVSASFAAQRLNDAIFRQPEFKGWSNSSLVPACLVAASGYAHLVQLDRDDFLLLASAAFDLIRGEEKTPERES